MNTSGIQSKIHSNEVQLKILQSGAKKKKNASTSLKALKGILQGKGNFSEKELEEADVKMSKSA